MPNNDFKEVYEFLMTISETSNRIDERIKILIENNNESKERIEKLFDQQNLLLNRITILENRNNTQLISDLKNEITILENKIDHLSERCLHVEKEVNQNSSKWSALIDFTFKIGVVVIGSIILWKMGLQP